MKKNKKEVEKAFKILERAKEERKEEEKNMSAKKMFWTGLIFQAVQFGVIALVAIILGLSTIKWNFWIVAGVVWAITNIASLILIFTGAIKMKE
jgi:hypothetical protein